MAKTRTATSTAIARAKLQPSEKRWHVIADEGGWVVRRERARRATKSFDSKSDAVDHANSLAKKSHGEVIVHRKDGRMASYKATRSSDGSLRTVYPPPAPSRSPRSIKI